MLVPLVAGVFDVSVGATMTLTGIVVAKLLSETSLPIWVIVLLGLGCGLVVGLMNSIVVVVLRIPSLIGTLAILGIVEAIAVGVSDNQIISSTRLSGEFSRDVVASQIFGFTRPVLYVLIIMVVLGLFLEQMQVGRFLYAVGFNAPAGAVGGPPHEVPPVRGVSHRWDDRVDRRHGPRRLRLVRVHQERVRQYLLPSFAAVFLGATQFRDFRFNVWARSSRSSCSAPASTDFSSLAHRAGCPTCSRESP